MQQDKANNQTQQTNDQAKAEHITTPEKKERETQYGQIPYSVGFYGYKNVNKKPDIS